MSVFRVPLARVRRVRDVLELEARADVSRANAVVAACEQRLADTSADAARALDELRAARHSTPFDVQAVLSATRYFDECVVRRASARDALDAARRIADAAHGLWLAKRVDARALATLQARARAEHALVDAQAEAATIDEAAARRADGRTASA